MLPNKRHGMCFPKMISGSLLLGQLCIFREIIDTIGRLQQLHSS